MGKMERAANLAGLAMQWYDTAERMPFPTKIVLQSQASKWVTEASRLKNEALTEMGYTFHKPQL